MKDQNIKTIRFPVTADQKLQKLADKTGLTKLDFFVYMVDYFYKSKKDPRDLNDELLKKELVKRTDTIIGFIKMMEEELLKPLKKDGEKIIRVQGAIVDFFNEHIITHNKEQKIAYSNQLTKLHSLDTSVKKIEELQVHKTLLKARFSKILEYYIKAREQMGVMTKQAEKDNLNQSVREQLQNL